MEKTTEGMCKMGYSLKQCKDDMCQIWKWLYENPSKGKEDFIKAHPDYPIFDQDCAACKYDEQFKDDCTDCPVNFPLNREGLPTCTHESSPFQKWNMSTTPRIRSINAKEVYKLALQIKVK